MPPRGPWFASRSRNDPPAGELTKPVPDRPHRHCQESCLPMSPHSHSIHALRWPAAFLRCAATAADAPVRTLTAERTSWPQWRGPDRSGMSPDTGFCKTGPLSRRSCCGRPKAWAAAMPASRVGGWPHLYDRQSGRRPGGDLRQCRRRQAALEEKHHRHRPQARLRRLALLRPASTATGCMRSLPAARSPA